MRGWLYSSLLVVAGAWVISCAPAVHVLAPSAERVRSTLWQEPVDLESRDLNYGPWAIEVVISRILSAIGYNQRVFNGISGGYKQFNFHRQHRELIDNRITPDDVLWASQLLSAMSSAGHQTGE